jgi:hypothetical protein
MTSIRRSRLAVRLSLAALGMLALVLVFALRFVPGERASAVVDPAVNFDLSSTVGTGCNTDGTATCSVPAGGTATISFDVTGVNAAGYKGYDLLLDFSGNVNYNIGSLVQAGAGVWPTCDLPTGELFPTGAPKPDASTEEANGSLSTACAQGVTHASPTMYTGTLLTFTITCKSSGTGALSIEQGDTNTDLVDASFASHSEAAAPALETLTISCGAGGPTNTPMPTNTPIGPTSTPTPCPTGGCPTSTSTPVPPTATHVPPTPTHAAKACGDVNDNGSINPVDALLILQLSAGLITSLQNAPSADVNHNGAVNAIDATLILQEAAGLIPASGLHCS